MNTVIYLSGLQVQIVVGTGNKSGVNIKSCFNEEAPEGSIINGIVMDVEAFTDFIRDLKRKRIVPAKDVSLVINSTKFMGRNIEMPVMNERKTMGYVAREFSDLGRESDSLYGYICLKQKNKFKKLYAEAIEPEFIKDYIEIFEKAGVKLKGIYSGESAIIGFTGITASSHVKTFQLIIADANSLTNVVWVNGSFYYYNSVRCFHDQGTTEYADDIGRNVSQITQFMKSNQLESHLEKILICGVEDSFIPVCAEAVAASGVNAPVEAFKFKSGGKVENFYQNYVRAASGLIEYNKASNYHNLFLNYEKLKKSAKNESSKKAFIIIGSVVLMMVLLLIASMLYKSGKQRELDKLLDYNESPEMLFNVGYYDTLMARNAFLTGQRESIVGLSENLKSYPRGNTIVLKSFDKCAENYAIVNYNSFNANDGTISITASSGDVESIHKFVQELMKEKMFASVNYTGYQFNEDTKMWDINVTCILAPSAGVKEK